MSAYQNVRIGLGEGDIRVIEYLLQICLQFLGGPHTGYASALMEIRVGMAAEWSESLKAVLQASWLINLWVREGNSWGWTKGVEGLP